ncbi:MAG TPA: hypothetical protein VML96_00635 [Egibacteraceae bacterium]|nr:hypothetical protein [Egibacteraceae bacterium]
MSEVSMRLVDIAYARSGDKGDVSNIGVIAKDDAAYERLARALTPERIKAHFGDWVKGEVTVYPMPNIAAYNVVCRRALGGGATSTLRLDQTGKAMATALLRMEVGQ